MEKITMNGKKIKSFALFLMLLIASLAVLQTVSGEELSDSVRGYIYIDGVIQQPNELTMSIDGKERNADELYSDGYYIINFGNGDISDAEFVIEIPEGSWLADKNQWKTEYISGVTIYYMNLSIDTSEDPIEPPEPNNAPNTPSNPSPADNADNRGINVDLNWDGGDPDSGDTVTYDIYFGTNNPPVDVESDYTTTSYDPGQLNYDTTYYWKITSEDNNGATTDGSVWSFNTVADSSDDGNGDGNDGSEDTNGGNGGSTGENGGVPPLTSNQPPEADAGDSYVDFIGAEITFDGSDSIDSDGDIVGYRWDFENDGNWDTEWLTDATTSFTYSTEFDGKVKLEVKDDDDATDTDTAAVNIMAGNNPPTKPTVTGSSSGQKNVIYGFSAVSTDSDNDNIKYTFYWGDGTSTETNYYDNGTQVTENNSWNSPGVYTIKVDAYDGQTHSGNTSYIVYIDTIEVSDGDVNGYLIDEESDGTYDYFYNEKTDNKTKTDKENEDYLLNTDGKDGFDYKFNITSGKISKYNNEGENQGDNDTSDNTLIYLGAVIFVILLLVLFYIATKRKKDKK